MKGIYQHCGEKHLHRYLAEYDFRYNNRAALGVADEARATKATSWYRWEAFDVPGLVSMVDVPVNKDVLVWARNERGLSEKDAAKRLKLSKSELAELESGKKKPSLALLDKIAQKYQIPFASLMMPEALPATKRPADFRTHEQGCLG